MLQALNIWIISAEERQRILSTLNQTLKSPEKMSLKLNYSILTMFYGLGCDVLDLHFWPALDKYLNVLSSLDQIIAGKRSISLTTDICHVKSALLVSRKTILLSRNYWLVNILFDTVILITSSISWVLNIVSPNTFPSHRVLTRSAKTFFLNASSRTITVIMS